jgi:hypothetical protein
MALRTPMGHTCRIKFWKSPECKIGIMDTGTRWQLCLKIERTSDGIGRKAFGLEFVKRVPGMFSGFAEGDRLDSVEGSASSGARKQGSDVVEGSTPSKTEEEPTSITGNVSIRGAGSL